MALQHRAQVEEFRRKHRTGLLTLVFTDIVGSTAPDRAQVEEFRRKHPTGLLTLMFTDIVGSTALKQGLGEREVASLFQLLVMRAFTDRHRPLRAAHAAVRQAARGQPHHSFRGPSVDHPLTE